jgi:hypothetical protein
VLLRHCFHRAAQGLSAAATSLAPAASPHHLKLEPNVNSVELTLAVPYTNPALFSHIFILVALRARQHELFVYACCRI